MNALVTPVIPANAGTHLLQQSDKSPLFGQPREMGSRVRGNDGGGVNGPKLAKRDGGQAPDPKLAKVAQQFEALFVCQMLKSARAAALADDPLEGRAGATFRDFQDEARAQALAKAAPLGVAKLLSGHR